MSPLKTRFEEICAVVKTEEGETWMTPIIEYIDNGTLTSRRNEAKIILRKSSHYTIQVGILYRRGFSNPLLRCVTGKEAKKS